jgi:hypothetical protein
LSILRLLFYLSQGIPSSIFLFEITKQDVVCTGVKPGNFGKLVRLEIVELCTFTNTGSDAASAHVLVIFTMIINNILSYKMKQ